MKNIIARMLFIVMAVLAYAGAMSCGGGTSALVSIAVTPATPSIAAGATQQFTATGTRADGSTVDITATVTWASSDAAVAGFLTPDVDKGLATGIAAGTATITATDAESSISGTTDMTVAALSGTAKALYDVNGVNWNDYILSDGADVFKATDAACNPATAGPGYRTCINGGIMRMVTVTGRGVCDDLTAADSLGAFTWVCDDTTNDVRMVSVGFAEGKGLSDLIDFDTGAWRQMNVTVYRGSYPYLATNLAALWGNTVVVNNTGAAMNTAGEVHIVTTNPAATYTIGADKVALLVKPGVTMYGPGGGADVVDATGHNFLWFEGAIDVTGGNYGMYWDGVRFSVIHNAVVDNDSGNSCVELSGGSSNNLIQNFQAYNCNRGMYLGNSSNNNSLYNVYAANSSSSGILIDNSSGNILHNIASFNNQTNDGLAIENSSNDNIAVNVTTPNNGTDGLYINASTNNVLINVTSSNTGLYGIYFGMSANANTVMNAAAVNQSNDGIWLNNSSNMQFANVASANNSTYGYELDTSSNNYFTGFVMVGNNATKDCDVAGGVNQGLDNTTCAPNGSSDFGTPVTGITLANSVIGKASSDTVNLQGTTGTSVYDSITDWTNFDNPFRGWGSEGLAFPHSSNTAPCASTDTCRIWDWSLASADTVIRNVLTLPTGNDTLTHTWSDASTVTFLRNAVEIIGDFIGNDNGLCESNETCLYTPNIGSYQGHGNLVSAGAFTDGTITGVTLMQYETNGR